MISTGTAFRKHNILTLACIFICSTGSDSSRRHNVWHECGQKCSITTSYDAARACKGQDHQGVPEARSYVLVNTASDAKKQLVWQHWIMCTAHDAFWWHCYHPTWSTCSVCTLCGFEWHHMSQEICNWQSLQGEESVWISSQGTVWMCIWYCDTKLRYVKHIASMFVVDQIARMKAKFLGCLSSKLCDVTSYNKSEYLNQPKLQIFSLCWC